VEPVILLRQDKSWEYANRAAEELFALIESKGTLPAPLHELVDRVITESKDFFPEDYSASFSVRAGTEVRSFLPTVTISSYSGQDDRWAVVLVLHDVTELQLIDELKTDLVGTVSHELKTPITGMRMALMLLMEQETDRTSQSYRLAELALEECERLLQTVLKLLEMTRVESREIELNRESVSPSDIVSGALEEVASLAGHRCVHLRKRLKSGPPEFQGDAELLRRVLVNLLSNAVKHSPSGAAVTVNVSFTAKSITFSVLDEGEGVPEKLLPMLFRRFYRVPGQSSEGSGLGLSIVKRYVEAHGGQVGAENRKERGARFWVRLPLRPE
jgi:signal transduction histidine kinase